ncbi:MAG: penicillin-binding protein 2 [Candidatus Pacebacteria bacterium]|nr:penicillin-binding protein 2 [Candidatus Paceibacterota bacterium]
MSRTSGNFNFRIKFLAVIFFVSAGLLVCRLFFLQVAESDTYKERATRQNNEYGSKESISVRGDIFFQEKDGDMISAAGIKDGYMVQVNPSLVSDPAVLCGKLLENVSLGINLDACAEKAGKKDDVSEILARKVSGADEEKISSLKITGLKTLFDQWRFYPGSSLASQILGFVGYKGDELVGRYGIEKYYEEVLRGAKEKLEANTSFTTMFLQYGKDLLDTDAYSGHDIVLTIEPRVQRVLEESLEILKDKWKAEGSGGIIIEPKTGKILAMASKPDFDPNNYQKAANMSFYRNPLVSDIFEVGSVMKPLTLAASMDAGKITSKTTYNDEGYVILNGRKIENYDGKARGVVDMQRVLDESLNTGAVFASQKLGKENFLRYLRNYGFEETTGIDLPDETRSHTDNLYSMKDVEFATASFGQGVAFTPLSFAMAAGSLANGGLLMKPYVVERILLDGGKDEIIEPMSKRRVLSEETSREITRMLVKVVDEALLGGSEKMEHYSIAAKTGTALLIRPADEGGGYYEDKYIHTFIGYGPAFNSRFLVFLYVEDPKEVKYASNTLTEPFIKIMKFLLNYYEVPPDR